MRAAGAIEPLVQTMPLWALAILLMAAAIIALEAGAWWGRREAIKAPKSDEKSDAQGYIIGSIFGLLAFLIGLTFSMALERYDDRRSWVAEEATAISTAYLRADLFDEPSRDQLRMSLRDYAHARLVPDDAPPQELASRANQNEQIRARLWKQTRDAIFPVRETELASYFVEAMNNMLDIGTRRILAGRAHVPPQILDALFLYLLVAATVLGALMGREGQKQRYSSTLLIILFVLGIVLILDIDRPREGSIKVSQRGLEELVTAMDKDAKVEASQASNPNP